MKHKRFIVLDDFGAAYLKEGGLLEALIDDVVCHREAEILPTIITTNLTPDELKYRLSDRVVDRFRGGLGARLHSARSQPAFHSADPPSGGAGGASSFS